MKFETYIPCDILKPYVKEFIIQETDDEQTYKVLPGTGLVIGFQYKGKLSRVHNETEIVLSSSGITGLQDSYRVFKYSKNIGSVLVIFKEAGAAPFFKQPLNDLFGESLSLENFMLRSELLILEEQLCGAKSGPEKIKVVEHFLITKLNPLPPDKLVFAALSIIHANKGIVKINELCAQLYTSQSPLEKRFRKTVGATPKKYASIIRFRHLLSQYATAPSLTSLGYEAGFYDQAHFIKEFKTFTGLTPENYFSTGQ